MSEAENRKYLKLDGGISIVWDYRNGKEIVYLEALNEYGQQIEEDEVLIETDTYKDAELAYENYIN